jgi:hypothetical protein
MDQRGKIGLKSRCRLSKKVEGVALKLAECERDNLGRSAALEERERIRVNGTAKLKVALRKY